MSQKKSPKNCYLILYRDPKSNQTVSIKARKITDSSLGLSFVAISDFVFEESGLLVNPEEEAKKLQFEDVKTLHLSIYAIQSVSEIADSKSLRFKNDKSNLFVLNNEPGGSPN